jgi:glucose-6-phosphate isomerase
MASDTTQADFYRQSVSGCMDSAIGAHGLTDSVLQSYLARVTPHLAALCEDYRSDRLPVLRISEATADLAEARSAFARLREGADMVVFFGTGGSSLGGQTLVQLSRGGDDTTMISFQDNLDAGSLNELLSTIDLNYTRFVVTSKSGGTSETLAQAIAALSAVKAKGMEKLIPKMFLGITEPAKPGKANGLRDLFSSLGIPMIEHHTGIGGRFSCLTNVGLLPAIAAGVDAAAVRAGARSVVEAMLSAKSPADFAPAVGAATAVALSKERGIRTLVMMPYNDRLSRFSAWFVQLWAESLGKGGEGTSPISALGPLDQHSQLQLFMDGPREHYLTVVRVASKGTGPRIDSIYARTAGIDFMGGKTIGDVVDAQSHAVPEALARAGRPVRTVDIAKLDEKSLGALLMHFMIETILAGRLLGADPFDQPAVELAKVLTKERLGSRA